MKIITGSSLYELMKYGENIDKDIKKNDIKSIERKVETKTTEYVTVLFFSKKLHGTFNGFISHYDFLGFYYFHNT